MLQHDSGVWIKNQDQLRNMVVSFYGSLYTESEHNRKLFAIRDSFPRIDTTIMADIGSQFFVDDVREALFAMKPWKAPGLDGIQAGFYQYHWSSVGGDLCVEVLRVLNGGEINVNMNKIIIYLILK